jgi:hypothetical protein
MAESRVVRSRRRAVMDCRSMFRQEQQWQSGRDKSLRAEEDALNDER